MPAEVADNELQPRMIDTTAHAYAHLRPTQAASCRLSVARRPRLLCNVAENSACANTEHHHVHLNSSSTTCTGIDVAFPAPSGLEELRHDHAHAVR